MLPDGTSLVPFRGEVDIERLVRAAPATHAIKGAFIASSAEILGADWARLESSLRAPPRGGKYVSFSNYPLTDFLRVNDAAARKKHPNVSSSEAHRLLSRETFDIFSKTQVGRVVVAMLSGPESVLTKYETFFNQMVSGPRVTVKITGPSTAEVSYTGYYSTREAIFGVIEGAVLACDFEPSLRVEGKGEGKYVAEVAWKKW